MANSVKELMDQLNLNITNSFVRDVVPVIKDKLHEKILDIYDEYIPKDGGINRRYTDDGYGDKENIYEDITVTNQGIKLRMENLAEARGQESGEQLSYYIEEGIYNYKGAKDVPPRPAFERTNDELLATDLVAKELEKSLAKKGIKLER